MARANAKVNTVPEEVTLVLSWGEFTALATVLGTVTPSEVPAKSKELVDSSVKYGDLLRPRGDVAIDKAPVKDLQELWRAVGPIYLGAGYK